ncbi:MAG: aminotransferase class V-fold PLP-dependent enzyme [Candidatus Bathyarchaeota archaeon]|nr:aminotransferase class V-fold PLP-dependent enzyme [Candidatus Termiticorpusculum sp.]
MRKVYTDNGSTSFPKAPGVSDVIKTFLDNTAYNINRGSYAGSYDVALEVLKTRQLLAEMFHAQTPQEIIFTPNATYSLNMLLHGFLKKGDHVITTSMEHNAVMRPLQALSKTGVTYSIVPCSKTGILNVDDILPFIKKETKALVMLHASNVCGTIMPIEKVYKICKEHNIRLIIDAVQTAGILDIDSRRMDALVFTGHKSLLGPQGIGGFVIKKEFADEITPLITGGTGSLSHEFEQPSFLPDKFESGTLNLPAIIGLKKALEYVTLTGIKTIFDHEIQLTTAFISKTSNITGVNLIGKQDSSDRVAIVSLDFINKDNASITAALDEQYGIMTRCGLHCAPIAHKTLGTYPHGTVRFSFGHFNTLDDIEYIVQSLKKILKNSGATCGL